ncbi:MAG TPA: antitoxin Xre-like helix-turn-helix domain-containing protein [Terriglobales bacterium]|nr:antitoxin Xre-like helix-turn-helix domain-containing protein [Terriglobales bacterium]
MATATTKTLNDYFVAWLGARAGSEQEVVRLVERGLPIRVLKRLQQRGLSRNEIASVIIPPRTLKHRRSRHEPLSREESERAVRTARILARAQLVMGDQAAALAWLRAPLRRFQGRTAMEMLATETGGRLVEQLLIQVDEGMFA